MILFIILSVLYVVVGLFSVYFVMWYTYHHDGTKKITADGLWLLLAAFIIWPIIDTITLIDMFVKKYKDGFIDLEKIFGEKK